MCFIPSRVAVRSIAINHVQPSTVPCSTSATVVAIPALLTRARTAQNSERGSCDDVLSRALLRDVMMEVRIGATSRPATAGPSGRLYLRHPRRTDANRKPYASP